MKTILITFIFLLATEFSLACEPRLENVNSGPGICDDLRLITTNGPNTVGDVNTNLIKARVLKLILRPNLSRLQVISGYSGKPEAKFEFPTLKCTLTLEGATQEEATQSLSGSKTLNVTGSEFTVKEVSLTSYSYSSQGVSFIAVANGSLKPTLTCISSVWDFWGFTLKEFSYLFSNVAKLANLKTCGKNKAKNHISISCLLHFDLREFCEMRTRLLLKFESIVNCTENL